jgi:hypothetical protein
MFIFVEVGDFTGYSNFIVIHTARLYCAEIQTKYTVKLHVENVLMFLKFRNKGAR